MHMTVQELMEDIVEAEEEPPLDPAEASVQAAAIAEQRAKGLKGKAGKIGNLLYGGNMPTWGYMPTC